MRKLLRLLGGVFLAIVALGVSQGCVVQGTVNLTKSADGKWTATSVNIPWGDVSPKSVQALEDRMNGK